MEETVLNKLTHFLWDMFKLNLIFMVSNGVLLLLLFNIVLHWVTLPLYTIGFIMLVVSLQNLVNSLKQYHKSELHIVSLYIQLYKEDFKANLKFSVVYISVITFLGSGYFILQQLDLGTILVPFYFILFILLYVHLLFGIIIRSNFIIGLKDSCKLAVYCIFNYPVKALLFFVGTYVIVTIVLALPIVIVIGILPMSGYFILKLTDKMIDQLKVLLKVETA